MRSRKRRDPYEEKKPYMVTDIFIGLCFSLFLISLGVIIAINLRPLYYLCISWFDIDTRSGLSADEIKLNYNALIDWCSPFHTGELRFPTLAASAAGISHFEDCKRIFNAIYIICGSGLLLSAAAVFWRTREREYRYLLVSSIMSVALPTVVGIMCLISFDFTFTLMHKILFTNDDWIFDPAKDPVINILPEGFFFVCAGVIILTVFVGALILLLRYRARKKRVRVTWLQPRKKNYIY
ncbi:MAG: TIGR01906 family membrane protein [Lachnospiraceae bacterium]|nr:TIGR01906 family membrane protein [Lachnospiraceae bacterium]